MQAAPHTHQFIETVKERLKQLTISPSSKILAGVSGGVDSMVMLQVLRTLGYPVSVAHVNFNLRGKDSILDAAFVQTWCKDHAIGYFELNSDTKSYCEEHKLGIQEAARNIRYEWWQQIVHQHEFDYVATAHHLDDSMETMLMNLFRGTGLKGLSGIPAKRDMYIRPLLDCAKADILQYAVENSIPYRNDVSNDTDHYQRNKWRHHVIPTIKEMYPGWDTSLKHSFQRMQIESQSWQQAYEQWELEEVSKGKDGYTVKNKPGMAGFLLRWLEEKGIPWMLANDFINAEEPKSGAILNYGHLTLFRTDNGYFLENNRSELYLQFHQPGIYKLGDATLEIEKLSIDDFSISNDPAIEFVSMTAIQWPLEIRPIEAGDRFQPIGMHGQSKKLQDYLVDLKMEMHLKQHQLVLCNPEHIVWVVGLRLDERAKVNPSDKWIYKITYARAT